MLDRKGWCVAYSSTTASFHCHVCRCLSATKRLWHTAWWCKGRADHVPCDGLSWATIPRHVAVTGFYSIHAWEPHFPLIVDWDIASCQIDPANFVGAFVGLDAAYLDT